MMYGAGECEMLGEAGASRRAVSDMRIYFGGQQGATRAMLFAGHALMLWAVFFSAIVLLDLGAVLLQAILTLPPVSVAPPLAVSQMPHIDPRGDFVRVAQQTLMDSATFFAIVACTAAVGVEIYWTVRRARRVNPPRFDG